jgi:hypothetical protein
VHHDWQDLSDEELESRLRTRWPSLPERWFTETVRQRDDETIAAFISEVLD